MEEQGALLRQDTSSGKISFSDPIYRVFAVSYFENENSSFHDLQQIKNNYLSELTIDLSRVFAQVSEELMNNIVLTTKVNFKSDKSRYLKQ